MKERHIIGILTLLVLIPVAISTYSAYSLDTAKIGENISQSLQLKDNYLKKYAFPEVKSHIFTAFAVPLPPKPVVIAPKKELPPPVDPYEQYYKDLKTYQIFGFSKDGGNNIVFLSRGDSTLTLKKGDTFGDKYVINELSESEVTVGLASDPNFKSVLSQNK